MSSDLRSTRAGRLRRLWIEFKGQRGTKSKPVAGPHLVYRFLTTAPNAVVEPIHPKAMPGILTTEEEPDVRMRAREMRPSHCNDRGPMRCDKGDQATAA